MNDKASASGPLLPVLFGCLLALAGAARSSATTFDTRPRPTALLARLVGCTIG